MMSSDWQHSKIPVLSTAHDLLPVPHSCIYGGEGVWRQVENAFSCVNCMQAACALAPGACL